MRLHIRHCTTHRYDAAPAGLAQLIRLTPSDSPAQRVHAWSVRDERGDEPARFLDGYENVTHFLARKGSPRETLIVAEGEVETFAAAGRLPQAREPLPPRLFLRATSLTAPHAALEALAREARAAAGAAVDTEAELLALAASVRDRVAHDPAATGVRTPAAEALAGAAGVCQDRAHVFLAGARALGHPARYVSGYQHDAAASGDGAMHAWAEVWLPSRGWLAMDPSTGERAGPAHVRIAVGLDYADAAPLRGVRTGGATEHMRVTVQIQEAQQQ